MAEMSIKTVHDLKKLTGWTIKEAGKLPDVIAGIGMRLSHPAAERDIVINFIAGVKMGRAGNVVIASEDIQIKVSDVIDDEKEA